MRPTDVFIRRPVLAIVVNLVILIAGLWSARSLSVRQYPRSDIAVIRVSTAYIGASADLVRGFITTPLERVIASADGIDYLESSSAQGLSAITVHLQLNYDTSAALTQIQAKVAQVRNDLPPEAEAPIIELETADSQFAAMYIGFASDELDQNQITDYLTRVVQPRLSAVSGVQRADILGDRTFAMRVWLKPDKMAALGIAPSEVHDALSRNNYLSALGRTKGSMVSVNLVANTDLSTPEEFRQLVVKEKDGVVVRLGEIADVVLGAANYEEDVRFDGQTATFMGIWVLPSANSLDVMKQVRKEMKGIEAGLPAGMRAGIPYDSTAYIQDALDEVLKTLTETLLIVVVVIFLFLGSFRAVLIPVVAIPISLLGAVFLMMAAGFTINLLTLLAVVLSVGLVVDDAIVMVENVERHLGEGKPPLEAALVAARELVGPIVAMTITLAAVYTPVAIQGGLTGALFREFAFTLAGAVVVSGVVALTLSPMMGSRLLRQGDTGRGFAGWVNRRFEAVRARYTRALSWTLADRPSVLGLWVIVVLLIVPFYMFSQKELAPFEDQGVVFGIVQASANATLDQTKLFAAKVYDVYKAFPETEHTFQITGPTGGFGGMVTKPWSQRKKTASQLLVETSGPLARIAGVRVIPMIPTPLPGGGDFPVDLVITSTAEPERLLEIANTLVGKAFASGLFLFADSDLKFDQPQAEVVFDRDKLRSQGVDLSRVGPGPRDAAGRGLREPLQHPGAQLQGDPAAQEEREADGGAALRDPRHGGGRQARPAVDLRFVADLHAAPGPPALPAAERGSHPGPAAPDGAARPGAQRPREGGGHPASAGIQHRPRRRVAPAAHGGREVPGDVPPLRDPHLPGPGRPVRELPRPLHHPRRLGAPGALRRAPLLVPGRHHAQHLQPGGPHHARGPRGEERDPDRRVRQPPPGSGPRQGAGRDRGRGDPPASDPDDDRGDRDGPLPARDRGGTRRRRPEQHRHHAGERHGDRHVLHALRRAGGLPGRRPGSRRGGFGREGGARPGARRALRSLELEERRLEPAGQTKEAGRSLIVQIFRRFRT